MVTKQMYVRTPKGVLTLESLEGETNFRAQTLPSFCYLNPIKAKRQKVVEIELSNGVHLQVTPDTMLWCIDENDNNVLVPVTKLSSEYRPKMVFNSVFTHSKPMQDMMSKMSPDLLYAFERTMTLDLNHVMTKENWKSPHYEEEWKVLMSGLNQVVYNQIMEMSTEYELDLHLYEDDVVDKEADAKALTWIANHKQWLLDQIDPSAHEEFEHWFEELLNYEGKPLECESEELAIQIQQEMIAAGYDTWRHGVKLYWPKYNDIPWIKNIFTMEADCVNLNKECKPIILNGVAMVFRKAK